MRGDLRRALLLAGAGAAGVALAWSGYLESAGALVPRCPLHAATGLWCPGCGGTRALMHLLHGDIFGALRFNAPAVLLAPFVAYWWVRHGDLNFIAWKRWQVLCLLALLAAFTIARNLPGHPFGLLRGIQ